MNPFEDLPSELVGIILSYFTIDSDIISFSHTCRANRALVFQFKDFQLSHHPLESEPPQSIENLFQIQCRRWYTPISGSSRPRPLKIKELAITFSKPDFLEKTMKDFDEREIVRLNLASIGPGQPLTTLFSQLASLPNLQHLQLDLQRAPRWNCTILQELEIHLVKLKTLELVNWNANFPLHLPHLVKLKVLGSRMIPTNLGFFFTSNCLTDVELSCRIDSPVVLPPTLRRLVLKDLTVPYDLSALPQLVELRLEDDRQNNLYATLSSLSSVSHLQVLGIHNFQSNSYAHLFQQLLAAQKLDRLDLFVEYVDYCTGLTFSLDLLSTLKSLRDLRLCVQSWLCQPQSVFKSLGKFPASVRMALNFSQHENNHMELFKRPERVWSLRTRDACAVFDWTRFVHLRHLELDCELEPEMVFSLPRATRTLSIKSRKFMETKPAWELVKNLFVNNPQLDAVLIHLVVRNRLDFLLESSCHADLVEVLCDDHYSATFLRTTSARQCTKRLPPSSDHNQPWYNQFGEFF